MVPAQGVMSQERLKAAGKKVDLKAVPAILR
jgi:hypothetical protein